MELGRRGDWRRMFGAWTAYRLRQSGRRVLLIDGYGAGNDRSSSGWSRIIRMGYGADEIYTLAQRALRLWQEFSALVDEPPSIGLVCCGWPPMILIRRNAPRLCRKLGLLREANHRRANQRYPQLLADDIAWAMPEPDSGALIANRAVQAVSARQLRAVVYRPELVRSPTGFASDRQLDFIVSETAHGFRCATSLRVAAGYRNSFPGVG
jgi:glycine/D-amino acid oxidase-like deaminating enzyme